MRESFPNSRKAQEAGTNNWNRFKEISESTHCPFADKSRLEFAPDWDEALPLEDNIEEAAKRLKTFTEECEKLELDGFVLEVVGDEYTKDLKAFSSFLRNTLTILQQKDSNTSYPMNKDISDNNWQFSFNGINLFIITFAPFYSKDNPRYSHTSNSAFLLFQPDSSFNSHIVNPADHPKTKKLKQNIRDGFSAENKAYDQNIVDSPVEAIKYIKPLNVGDSPVVWWKED